MCIYLCAWKVKDSESISRLCFYISFFFSLCVFPVNATATEESWEPTRLPKVSGCMSECVYEEEHVMWESVFMFTCFQYITIFKREKFQFHHSPTPTFLSCPHGIVSSLIVSNLEEPQLIPFFLGAPSIENGMKGRKKRRKELRLKHTNFFCSFVISYY